jgi:riboflavin kinase/FMN adenylyltransferase
VAVWRSPSEVPADLGRTVVTIGVFDGVHRGHQVVIGRAAKLAGELGVPVVAVTFDPNPMAVIRPEQAPPELMPVARRAELLRAAGVDHVLVLPFGRERSEQVAEDFVDDVIVRLLGARAVVVGDDFRFGHRAAGNVQLLEQLGAERDFAVDAVGAAGDEATERWSSTQIRTYIAEGEVAAAASALGRPFRVDGVVVHGDQRGRALGFPTANVPVDERTLVPADGVYAGWLTRHDDPATGRMPAAISVGTNPTFDGVARKVEAYVLDRDDLELYGVTVAVEFVARLRGQERFGDIDELVSQMSADVVAARVALDLA